jgi:branched-chain amino acid transport system ATP-binding protein
MEVLRISNLSKSFGAIKVANAIDLVVSEGDALGILGPNGAGKTTLFNLISGTLQPDSGSVHFLGKNITSLSAENRCRAGLGRTFQIPKPFGKMTVLENCLVAATAGGGKREKHCYAHCAEILGQMHLIKKANELAGSLTLLERKALEVARALSSSPRLLLLDEIAGGLTDAEATELVMMIQQVHKGGTTILWIEHIVRALLAVATRLLVIDFGVKVMEGVPAEVMDSPEVKRIYMGMEAV